RRAAEARVPARRRPPTRHAYRLRATAAPPLANMLLSHRLKRGKETPARLPERRGESTVARPTGPLVWVHGASVGEIAAVIPLVERIIAQDFNVLVTPGTVPSAPLADP